MIGRTVLPLSGGVQAGWPPKKCHESETEAGVATREITEEPQVTQDQHVTGNETLHGLL